MINIRVDTKEVDQMFKDLIKKAPQAADNAIVATLIDIERDAKRLAPVDTGRLRSSINWKYDKDNKSGTVGTNVVYAAAQEFGSHSQNIAPKPYMYPAYYKNKEKIIGRLKKELDK